MPSHPPLYDDEFLARHLDVGGAQHLSSSARHGTWRIDRDDRELVLKVFPGDQEIRFLREIAVLHDITHPNLMAFDRCGKVDGPSGPLFWYTAAHVPGGDAAHAIDARAWPDPAATGGFVAAMASVLAELHGRSIVHCDVKPANIALRDGDWRAPVLLDPGIVRFIGSDPPDRSPVGTTPYMAPEQLRREPAEPASDVFGLGVVLYLVLSRGRHPFVDPGERISRSEAEERMQRGPEAPVEGPLGRLVARMLAPVAHRRPAASVLAESITNC